MALVWDVKIDNKCGKSVLEINWVEKIDEMTGIWVIKEWCNEEVAWIDAVVLYRCNIVVKNEYCKLWIVLIYSLLPLVKWIGLYCKNCALYGVNKNDRRRVSSNRDDIDGIWFVDRYPEVFKLCDNDMRWVK